jgi:hypothetical protein
MGDMMTEHAESDGRESGGGNLPSRQRAASPTRGRVSLGQGVVGALLLLVGLASAGYLAISLADQIPFWLGQRTTAEVLDLSYELEGEDRQGQQVFRYSVEYRFELPDGRSLTRTERVAAQEWGRVEVGGRIAVLYSPLHPDRVRLDYRRMAPVFVFCSMPIAVVAGFGLVYGWRSLLDAVAKTGG